MNNWLIQLIAQVFIVMSPQLREQLKQTVLKMEADAKKTENVWDDIFVGVLKSILGITNGA